MPSTQIITRLPSGVTTIDAYVGGARVITKAVVVAGVGVARGGTVDQVLVKRSTTDYDTEWADGIPGADPHLIDTDATGTPPDNVIWSFDAIRPDTGDVFDSGGQVSLFDGWRGKVTPTVPLSADYMQFASSLPLGCGYPVAITAGDSGAMLAAVNREGIFRPANAWPLLLWSDSMFGKMDQQRLNQLRTRCGLNVVQQAYSGDFPYWIAARQGGLPAKVRVTGGVIPATGDVAIKVSPQLAASDGVAFVCQLAGVAGIFQPLQVTGIADSSDPGNVPFTYTTGTFTRRTAGPPIPVPDDTPLQLGHRFRNMRPVVSPSRHLYYRRWIDITIPAAATGGTFKLAYNGQTSADITVTPETGDLAGDTATMASIADKVNDLTGATGVYVTQGWADGTINWPDRNFSIQFGDDDTALPITVASSSLTGTASLPTIHTPAGEVGDGTEETLRCVQAMVDVMTDISKNQLTITDLGPFSGETLGTTRRVRFDAMNAALAATFPQYYFPLWQMLRSSAVMAFYGYTATANDLADIATGITPRQLRTQRDASIDPGHLGDAGYDILSSLIAMRYGSRRDNWQ